MKEIFAGLILAATLAAVVTSSVSNGQGTDTRMPDRQAAWSDLRGRDRAPEIRDARFTGPRNVPIQINSPAVLLEPAKRFADALAGFAADIGAGAGPELGPAWLVSRAARAAEPDGPARAEAPRATGPAQRAPLPRPRPDPAAQTQGVLSAGLALLEKAGLEAMSHAGALGPAPADKAGMAPTPAPESDGPDQGWALHDSHPDRAPGRRI